MAFFYPEPATSERFIEGDDRRQGCPPRSGGHPSSPSLSISNICNGDPSEKLHKLTGMHKRSAQVLYLGIKELERQAKLEYMLFLTFTYSDAVEDQKESKRRFRSLQNGVLKKMFPLGVWCTERMVKGRLHFHMAVRTKEPVRGDFDFETFYQAQEEYEAHGKTAKFRALRAKYVKTAPPELRRMWQVFKWRNPSDRPKDRKQWTVLERYGFGRCQVTPFMATNPEAIARYMAKYLGKHIGKRTENDKGAKLHGRWGFEYTPAVCNFAWATPHAWLWRKKLEKFCKSNGVQDYRGIKEKWGKHWAWLLQDAIMSEDIKRGEEKVVYPTLAHWEADNGPWPEWQALPDGPIEVTGTKDRRRGEARLDPIWIEHEDEPVPVHQVTPEQRAQAERHEAETGALLRREILMNPLWVRSDYAESIADREARRLAMWQSWQSARPKLPDSVSFS